MVHKCKVSFAFVCISWVLTSIVLMDALSIHTLNSSIFEWPWGKRWSFSQTLSLVLPFTEIYIYTSHNSVHQHRWQRSSRVSISQTWAITTLKVFADLFYPVSFVLDISCSVSFIALSVDNNLWMSSQSPVPIDRFERFECLRTSESRLCQPRREVSGWNADFKKGSGVNC